MWVFFALLTSLINAVYYIFNQDSRLKPSLFMVYRGYYLALAATPLALCFWHTFPWQFYMIALMQGLLISYSDFKYFQAFQKFGAENVTSINPLTVIIMFFIWFIFAPEMILSYLSTPLRTFLIMASILIIVISVMKYRAQPIGLKCFRFMAPILLISSLINISNKIIMQYADFHLLTATITRVALTGLVIGTINLFYGLKHNLQTKDIIAIKNLKRGLFILLLALSMICLNFSMHYTEHPAYTSAIIYLSVVWIILINKIRTLSGYKLPYQKLQKKWIFALLIATVVLSVVTG